MPARWMRDEETDCCLQCRCEFTAINRKHHCRACGKIFCDDCTNVKLLIPKDQFVYPRSDNQLVPNLSEPDPCEPQRCCGMCTRTLAPKQEALRQQSKANQSNYIDRDSFDRYLNSPIQFTLEAEIRKAAYTLYNFTHDNAIEGADSIPRELIWGAKGIAFLTVVKAGFFFTGRVGTGLVIGRNDDGSWSAPSAICSTGVGWGFQVGGEVTDVVIILNSTSALTAFASNAGVSLGTELSVSLGPLGRTAATDVLAGDKGASAAFSYAHSKGFFVGVSLEAGLLVTRHDVNQSFYGQSVSNTDLLLGYYPSPKAAAPLYQALNEVMTGAEFDDGGFGGGNNPAGSSSAAAGYPAANPSYGYDNENDSALGNPNYPMSGMGGDSNNMETYTAGMGTLKSFTTAVGMGGKADDAELYGREMDAMKPMRPMVGNALKAAARKELDEIEL